MGSKVEEKCESGSLHLLCEFVIYTYVCSGIYVYVQYDELVCCTLKEQLSV